MGNNPAAGNNIFLATGSGTYTGGVTLLDNQRLVGQGSTGTSLETLLGITLAPNSNALPTLNGTRSTITGGVTLGQNNTLQGLNLGDAGTFALSGGTVGNLTVSEAIVNNTMGGGVNIANGGMLDVTLDSLSSTGGTNGVNLVNTTGTFTANGGAIANSTGTAFNINGGTANVNYNGTIGQNNANSAVAINGKTSGTVNFNGAIVANTSTANAINLTNNTGATINFDGGLGITTTTGTGFNATGGGTLNVTGANNNINTTAGTAIDIQNSTIGTSNIAFNNVTSTNAAAADGININNLDGGTFDITGTTTISGSGVHGIDIAGGSSATFNVANAVIDNTTGNGINLNGANGAVTFTTVDIDGTGGAGVAITDNTNAVNVNGGTIGATTTTTGNAVDIANAQGTIAIAAAITNSLGRSVEVTNSGGTLANTINFTGAINDTGTGIFLDNNDQNAGATIDFSGGLTLNTTTNDAFTATNGGTVTVQGNSNTITTTTGTAVNVANTTIGTIGAGPPTTYGMTFRSISANGGTNGIILNNAGNGGFSVTGDGATAASGGIIQSITNRGVDIQTTNNINLQFMRFDNAGSTNGDDPLNASSNCGDPATGSNTACNAAIHLQNASNIILDNIDINSGAQVGINGNTVTNLTISNTTIDMVGNEQREAGLNLFGASGTVNITNSNIDGGGPERAALIANYGSENMNLNVTSSTFRDTQDTGIGADGLEIRGAGSSVSDINIVNSSFLSNRTFGVQLNTEGTAQARIDITGSTFNPNILNPGTGIGIGISLGAIGSSQLDFNIINNPMIYSRSGGAIGGTAFDNARLEGRVNNNPDIQVLSGGSGSGSGIDFKVDGNNNNATAILEIDNNTISGIQNDIGIDLGTRGTGGTGRMDATVSNNNITVGASAFGDIFIESQTNTTLCANVANNTTSGAGAFGAAFLVNEGGSSSLLLENFMTDVATTWNNNTNTPAGSVLTSGGTPAAATCNTVSITMP